MNSFFKPGLSIDELKEEFLIQVARDQDASSFLFELLDLLWELRDAQTGGEFLANLLVTWVINEEINLNNHRYDIRNTINHDGRVKRLKVLFEGFDHETSFTELFSQVAKKEVNHE